MVKHLPPARLGTISLGLAFGIAWGFSIAFLGVMAAAFEWGVLVAMTLSNLYIGFGPTFVGAIAGAVWGFAHGFAMGAMIAFLYNRFIVHRHVHLMPHQSADHAPPSHSADGFEKGAPPAV